MATTVRDGLLTRGSEQVVLRIGGMNVALASRALGQIRLRGGLSIEAEYLQYYFKEYTTKKSSLASNYSQYFLECCCPILLPNAKWRDLIASRKGISVHYGLVAGGNCTSTVQCACAPQERALSTIPLHHFHQRYTSSVRRSCLYSNNISAVLLGILQQPWPRQRAIRGLSPYQNGGLNLQTLQNKRQRSWAYHSSEQAARCFHNSGSQWISSQTSHLQNEKAMLTASSSQGPKPYRSTPDSRRWFAVKRKEFGLGEHSWAGLVWVVRVCSEQWLTRKLVCLEGRASLRGGLSFYSSSTDHHRRTSHKQMVSMER